MLSEMIYKENRGTAIKYIVKNIIIKESATNVFQVCMSIVYDSFTLELKFTSVLDCIVTVEIM